MKTKTFSINGTAEGKRQSLTVKADTRKQAVEKVRLARPEFEIEAVAEPFGGGVEALLKEQNDTLGRIERSLWPLGLVGWIVIGAAVLGVVVSLLGAVLAALVGATR